MNALSGVHFENSFTSRRFFCEVYAYAALHDTRNLYGSFPKAMLGALYRSQDDIFSVSSPHPFILRNVYTVCIAHLLAYGIIIVGASFRSLCALECLLFVVIVFRFF